jgi:hypothetical protein
MSYITGPTTIASGGTYTWTATATSTGPNAGFEWYFSHDGVNWQKVKGEAYIFSGGQPTTSCTCAGTFTSSYTRQVSASDGVFYLRAMVASFSERAYSDLRVDASGAVTPQAPSASVSNVAGSPSISWGALPGASYYQIVRIEERKIYDYERGDSYVVDEHVLGTTSGTSWHDTSVLYTGVSSCYYPQNLDQSYFYEVRAHYSGAVTRSGWIDAPIANCH